MNKSQATRKNSYTLQLFNKWLHSTNFAWYNSKMRIFYFLFVITLLPFGCGKQKVSSGADIQETAQQIGDIMASVDESSGSSSGTLGMIEETHQKMFARLNGDSINTLNHWSLIPNAYATTCALASTFGACSGGAITRTFGGCTIGLASFIGTVSISWGNGAACALSGTSDTITRVPAFTVTGRRGATLTVNKTSAIGQRITWISGAGASRVFQFSNDGIRRVFAANGTTLFDFTTATTSPITITGTARSSRTMSGGNLRVTHNLSGVTCDYAPTSVAWSATCNCAVSGSWAASCSDGKTSSLTHTGCGTANFTMGSDTEAVTFDRCYGI